MNDVTVVTSVTYPSPESLALVADVQYHEPYLSAALNRKFRGIVDPGFYAGFLPKPGGGMNLLITSVDGDKTAGAASCNQVNHLIPTRVLVKGGEITCKMLK